MRKVFSVILLSITAIVLLSGCGKYGKLNDGDCVSYISLESIPDEFMVEEDGKDYNTHISLTLKNMSNSKSYKIELNKDNNFESKINIDSGTYKIEGCYFYSKYINNVKVDSREETVNLTKEGEGHITLYVENLDEIPSLVNNVVPTEEIINADKFSKLVQINGQVFSLVDILNYIPFSNKSSSIISGEEFELYNKEYGIGVTLINTQNETVSWEQCKVKSVQVDGHNVVLPSGISLYMSMKKIASNKNGIYGKPDELSGSIFWTFGLDYTGAIYIDENTGDRIIIKSYDRKSIDGVTYEFNQF